MEPVAGQRIRAHQVMTPGGIYLVQTVRVFETAVYRLPSGRMMNPVFSCKRYQDIDDALEGHEAMISRVAAGKVDWSCN
jgi:hypothetical protein